jgi:EF hand domain-containing protein
MRNHVLVLTTTAVILACGVAASAQAPGSQSPSTQQSPTTQPTPGGPMMMQQQDQTIRERLREQLQERAQRGEEEDSDQDGYHHGGMMGGAMMGRGMMGRGYGYDDWNRGAMRSGMAGPPMMMRMIFSLMDADGDGKLSLQEFQAAHERIFKAMDANKDGFVTAEEMQEFIRGTSRPTSRQ